LAYLIADSLNKTYIDDNELKKTMFGNIILSGGTTMMSGFSNRIYKELPTHLSHFNYDNSNNKSDIEFSHLTNIVSEGYRNIAPWIGASMVASMSTFNQVFVTKEDFNEGGERVLQKCF
jgi:actin beta/gamma 1